jgi:branched-chain amino acid transport system ATP-binding protein
VAEETLEEVYTTFPVLKERSSQMAGTLSGGEQQMLSLGRALMARPKLLLLDEPSLGLAPLIASEIFRTIANLRDQGVTILLVEQNARAALALADRGYVLETGTVVLQDKADRLLQNREVQRAYLGKGKKEIWDA